jgi:hypothetical protein
MYNLSAPAAEATKVPQHRFCLLVIKVCHQGAGKLLPNEASLRFLVRARANILMG